MDQEAISISKAPDFSGITLTQSAIGHVHSPWFSFDWHRGIQGEQIYDIGGKYHEIKDQAVRAFSGVLGIDRGNVIVTEKVFPGEYDQFWRLGTKGPCKMPVAKITAKQKPEAIEI
jgi:hypothetical protein